MNKVTPTDSSAGVLLCLVDEKLFALLAQAHCIDRHWLEILFDKVRTKVILCLTDMFRHIGVIALCMAA